MKPRQLQVSAWGISLVTAILAFVAWGRGFSWQFGRLDGFGIFPLFGLLAFSLMWSHYIAAALRLYFKLDKVVLRGYFEITSAVVLLAILIHPSLLAYELWRSGLGLPPESELHYLSPKLTIYILIAMLAWLVFLSYEFRRFFGQKSWWKYVQYGSDIAIWAIYIHALKVGTQVQVGWFHALWIFYGLTLAGALGYIYYYKYQQAKQPKHPLQK